MAHAVRNTHEMTAEETIRGLAREHGITAERTAMDAWADDVARLSDAEVSPDEIADLVVTLKRHGILTAARASELYGEYLSSGA